MDPIIFDKPLVSRNRRLERVVRSTPGLLIWFKPDSVKVGDGEIATVWPDVSGNGFHATASGNPRLIKNVLNGRSVIRLDGSSGFQLSNAVEPNFDLAQYTIIAVARRTGGSSGTIVSKDNLIANNTRRKFQLTIISALNLAAGADGSSVNLTLTTTNWNIVGAVARSNSDHDLLANGTVNNFSTTLDDTSFNDGKFEIGQAFSNGAERLTGDIAELIMYRSAIPAAKQIAIMAYLGKKYNLAVSS